MLVAEEHIAVEMPTLNIKKRDMKVVQAQVEIEQAVAECDSLIAALDAVNERMQKVLKNELIIKALYIENLDQ
jgi:hypothetical protein